MNDKSNKNDKKTERRDIGSVLKDQIANGDNAWFHRQSDEEPHNTKRNNSVFVV